MKYTKQQVIDKINRDRQNSTIEYDIDNPQLLKEIYQELQIHKDYNNIGGYYWYFFDYPHVAANLKLSGHKRYPKVIKLSEIIEEINYEVY